MGKDIPSKPDRALRIFDVFDVFIFCQKMGLYLASRSSRPMLEKETKNILHFQFFFCFISGSKMATK